MEDAPKATITSSSEPKKDIKEFSAKDYYADSYAHYGIHEEMLKDEVRTLTYRDSMIQNKHLFKDKVVLDVGCGTGILSMFASQAGAKHVYSVDMSNIIDVAKDIVKDNGFGEDKITLVKGKIEEIELPNLDKITNGKNKVDIIISEWMGYALVYDSMLQSVLFARDKWLVQDGSGILMPDKTSMYVCAIEDREYKKEKLDYWDNVYGFNYKRIKEIANIEPIVDTVDYKQVCTNDSKLIDFDLYTVTKEDVSTFSANYKIKAHRNDYIQALVLYWTCEFTKCHTFTGFSTGPGHAYTHWKQVVFYLPKDLTVNKNEVLSGKVSFLQAKGNHRDLDIEISYEFDGELSKIGESQKYKMR